MPVGCFRDDPSSRTMSFPLINGVPSNSYNTWNSCREQARAGGWKYFALQDGNGDGVMGHGQCFVSNKLADAAQRGSALTGSRSCNRTMADGHNLGGEDANYVYDRVDVTPQQQSEYIGCFKDDNVARLMAFPVVNGAPLNTYNTWNYCREQARLGAWKYFGLQDGGGNGVDGNAQCFVSTNLENITRLGPSPACIRLDSEKHNIGGPGANSIYKVL